MGIRQQNESTKNRLASDRSHLPIDHKIQANKRLVFHSKRPGKKNKSLVNEQV